jgi:hypothetical protein
MTLCAKRVLSIVLSGADRGSPLLMLALLLHQLRCCSPSATSNTCGHLLGARTRSSNNNNRTRKATQHNDGEGRTPEVKHLALEGSAAEWLQPGDCAMRALSCV